MQRISTEVDGRFKNGVRGVQRGTRFNAEWCNAVQEEIATFIETAGITLDASNNSQLYAALLAILAAGVATGNIDVAQGKTVEINGVGAHCSIGASGITISYSSSGGVTQTVSLTYDGLNIAGVSLSAASRGGAAVLDISEAVELAKNLIVNGAATFRNNVTIAEGKKLVGDTEGHHVGNVTGRVTGNTSGTHYGNVYTDNMYAQSNGGAIGINAATIFSQQPNFQKGFVSAFLAVASTGYSSELMDSSEYTSMPNGSVVNCLNVSGGLSGVAVSASEYMVMRPGTGVTVVKHNGRWYPMCPDVEFGSR